MADTVFLLDGWAYIGFLEYTRIAQTIGSPPNTMVHVPYDNLFPSTANVVAAAATLDSYLHSTAGSKKVLSIALGSQVAGKWLRDYGPTSTIPTSDLSFILLGNPENKYTGSVRSAQYGGWGIPDGTPYTVTDFVRQYDGFADYPNVPNPNWIAVANAGVGAIVISGNYFDADLASPDNTSTTVGNITYIWNKTFPLPWLSPIPEPAPRMTNFVSDFLRGVRADKIGVYPGRLAPTLKGAAFAVLPASQEHTPLSDLDDLYRPTVEAAYDRTVVVSPPPGFVDNLDGTGTVPGGYFTDNGDGTATVTLPTFVDHGDGTATV